MFRNLQVWLLSILFVCVGGFAFFVYNNFIVFNFPSSTDDYKLRGNLISRKDIRLFLWKDNKFFSEKSSVIWSEDLKKDLMSLVNTWLGFAYDEQIIDRRLSLEKVFLSEIGEVYLSFDSCIVSKEWSILDKWHFMESLFKTIKESSLNVNTIKFLVRHKPMSDEHLDFSEMWPIDGFLS